jgi:osmotically-inducible protein OsmY
VTLGGQIASDSKKAHAESIAASVANGQVASDQIAVLPAGAESEGRTVNSDLDKGIEQNLDAELIQSKLHDRVKFAVKSQVVTLTGEVDSQATRRQAGKIVTSIPYIQQVVNEQQVKNQKATSSE